MNTSRERLEFLLTNLQSPDNELRTLAEQELSSNWVSGGLEARSTLLLGLSELATRGNPQYRSFAAILLRRYASKALPGVNGVERLIDGLNSEARTQIRNELMAAFVVPEQTRDVRHKLADAMAEVAGGVEPWAELPELLLNASRNETPDVREGVFRLFAALGDLVQKFPMIANGIVALMQAGFEDPEEIVRIAAAKTFSELFEFMPESSWKHLSPLLPPLLSVLEPLRQQNKSEELSLVFGSIVNLVVQAPKMFKNIFMEVVEFALQVAADTSLDTNARIGALEFATTFVDEAPKMCRQYPQYVERMVIQCLSLLTEVGADDDDAAEWNNEDDFSVIEEEEVIHGTAKISLDRLSLKLGGELVLPVLFQYLPKMAKSESWRERHAALMAISNVAEGCCDVMLTELAQVIDLVIPELDDPHPRVQWAACNTLGQMSTDFSDVVQRRYHDRVVPGLMSKMTPQSTPRVQAHAAAAMFNFSEGASEEVLTPYMHDLLGRLLYLLHSPKRYVQEQVLATISIVADAARAPFVEFYDTMMPILIEIMTSANSEEYRVLRAKAIECTTLIAAAARREKFQQHSQQVVNIFLTIQNSADEEDPCHPYLIQAWARLCDMIGPEFLPYLENVMPRLFAVAEYQSSAKALDAEEAAALEQTDEWEVFTAAGRLYGVYTSANEDKASAIVLFRVYCTALGADFYPYIERLVQHVIVPGLSYGYHPAVCYASAQIIPSVISAMQLYCARQNNGNEVPADPLVLQLWKVLVEAMIPQIASSDDGTEDTPLISEIYLTICESALLIGPPATPQPLVQILTENIRSHLEAIRERVAAREIGSDNEYYEDLSDDEAEGDDVGLMESSNKLIHLFFKQQKGEYLPTFQLLLPVLAPLLKSKNDDCLEWALCCVGDLLEYASPQAAEFQSLFLEPLCEGIVHASARVRQIACYALGMAAWHGGEVFGSVAVQQLESLFRAVTFPGSRDDGVEANETATATISRILRSFGNLLGDRLPMAQSEFIRLLPLTQDTECANVATLYLVELVEQSSPAVSEHAQHVFSALCETIASRVLTAKAQVRAVSAAKALLGALGEATALSLISSMSENDRSYLNEVFSK